jgi:hypothetical protein
MGNILSSKQPKLIRRKDANVPVKLYCSGGMAKGGSVNKAGNYTKPSMRKSLFNRIKASATQGTKAGQWSARKAQLLAKQYKAKGGGYRD